MFGYVTVNKPELKIKEFARYQSFYCGLCHELYRRHGIRGQFTLTYDMTFLVILLSSLYEPDTSLSRRHCAVHPIQRKPVLINAVTGYGADMNILLAYYKYIDDLRDDHSLRAAGILHVLHRRYRAVRDLYPEKSKTIRRCLRELSMLEKENCTDIEQTSGCFGRLMAELFAFPARECSFADQSGFGDSFVPLLRRFGFFLGKFIYVMDAFFDYDEDQTQNRYNPFRGTAQRLSRDAFETTGRQILEVNIAQASRAFEQLPLTKDAGLLRNIIYAGVWNRFDHRKEKKNSPSQKITACLERI